MSTIEEALHTIQAHTILDVATGRGDFILFLKEHLGSFGSAVGIDIKKSSGWTTQEINTSQIHFLEMDAAKLDFQDGSFDLVSISNSLHHMAQPARVLSEMTRVLKPGGIFLFHEMYTDRQTPAQQTHTLLHQWWGKIDTLEGVWHNSPFKRSEMIRFLKETGIEHWEYFDEADLSGDPLDLELVSQLGKIIEDYQGKTKDETLIAEGKTLRRRVHEMGFQSASEFLAIGKK
jgi:ubiquinone/menaquinone biosynthesis C-methylase UbiE